MKTPPCISSIFFFNDTATTEIYTLSLHDALPIFPEQKKIEGLGGNMRLGGKDVMLRPNTLVSRLFNNSTQIRLRFRHRYEVDPKYIDILERHGLIFSGKAPNHPIMQVLELPQDVHPFFLGTQAHPELTSRPLRPQPMFMGFIQAAMEYAENRHPQGQTQAV